MSLWHIFKRKEVKTVQDSDPKVIEGIQTWRVEWTSCYGIYDTSVRRETQCEFFPSEEIAHSFAKDLRAAHEILKNEGHVIKVIVKENA